MNTGLQNRNARFDSSVPRSQDRPETRAKPQYRRAALPSAAAAETVTESLPETVLGATRSQNGSHGFCGCGCGEPTWVATKTSAKYGWKQGEPVRFRHGHHSRRTSADYAVDEPTGCWAWLGSIKPDTGYGILRVDNQTRYAHRVYYERFVGPIADGLVIDHLCRNRACVNPDHLEPVTSGENVLRGEGPSAQQVRATHCKRGHPLAGENLYEHRGRRMCKACQHSRNRAVAERDKAAFAAFRAAGGSPGFKRWVATGRPAHPRLVSL